MHWLLAYTKPRQERIAEENLLRQGFEVLCPQIKVQKLRRRQFTWLAEPLFPRYVFVGAHDDQSWAPVRSTIGVASLVKFGGRFATVPPALVQTLRDSAAEPELQHPLFEQGQLVRIVAGPFAALQGVFQMADGAQRATVLLELLGRQSPVTVDVHQLVAEE
jgi:transcriptional antiterminator RfaH